MSDDFQRRVVSEKDVPPHIKARVLQMQQEHDQWAQLSDQIDDVLYVDTLRNEAQAGNVDSQIRYAYVCMYGLFGSAISQDTAVTYFMLAAKAGNAEAQTQLGHCYFHCEGVQKYYDVDVEWYL